MSAIDDLVPHLKKLRLSGILQSLELRLQQAREDSLPYEEFLFRLLSDEVERRDGKQLEQLLPRTLADVQSRGLADGHHWGWSYARAA